jgi:hypothetical protein
MEAMHEIFAGLGNLICRGALEIGFAGAQFARCYEASTVQSIGYTAAALLLLTACGVRQVRRSP